MAEDGVAQGRLLLAVLCPGALNDIANFHIRRAGDLAALAVNAVLQRLVVQRAILQTQAFAVRPRLFRAGIAGLTRLTGQVVVQTVHLMQLSKRVSFMAGLRQGRGSVWRRAAR